MFLSRRSRQAEYFDAERPMAELADFFGSLNRVNRIFGFAEPFQRLIPKIIGQSHCGSLSILDLGAGDGTLGRILKQWARGRGWNWRVINLDVNFSALNLNPGEPNITASAIALPFRDDSVDLVIASQMAHHLTDNDVIGLFREAGRVARQAILLTDLHRSLLLYVMLWLLLRFQGQAGHFYRDALLSVRRGWRAHELRRLLRLAGASGARTTVYFGARVIVEISKAPTIPQ